MRTFNELILKHKGKVFCIMGGAPSLGSDLECVKADVYISANDHGARLRPVDYVVAMDENHGKLARPMVPFIREVTDAPIISCHNQGDYQLATWPGHPRKTLSGVVAAWCAWAMGAKVIVLAGFDAYNGKPYALRDMKLLLQDVTVPIRVVGRLVSFQGIGDAEERFVKANPVIDIFDMYDPREKFGRYIPSTKIEGLLFVNNTIRVRVRKPTEFRGQRVHKDQELTGQRDEFDRLLRHRMVIEL